MLAISQVLNKILQSKDYTIVKKNGLDQTYFQGFENEFNFIQEHVQKYNNVPDTTTFLEKFPEFQLYEVNESDDYLLDKLYEQYGYNKFVPIIPKLSQLLQVDSRDAYEYLNAQMRDLKPRTLAVGVDIIANAKERYEKYLERAKCPELATIKTGLIELDDIFGGWEYGDELVTIVARTNVGKCLEKGTEVLMATGTYKKVEDIQIGDKVQSENHVNTVTGLHNGRSIGYKIIPNVGGQPFVVSDNHILTLMKKNYQLKQRELIDIKIEDYLRLPEKEKRNYFLYRPTLNYNENKNLEIPPYILGLWLGDGHSSSVCLTNIDKEIINEWTNYATQNGQQITYRHLSYDITSGTHKGSPKRNIVLTAFKKYNLIRNKHIPLEYLTSSRQQRLELLAGLIDTDGYYARGQRLYQISTKLENLANDYYQLISGLGFKAKKSLNYAYLKGKKCGPYYTISFSGDLHEIPVKLDRKKQLQPKIRKDYNCTRFKVERVDSIEYYGFECDGDHRFILRDGTLTHNSWMLMKFLAEAWKQGKRVGLYSGEMNHIKLGYRFDALFGHFSNKCLTLGAQTDGYDTFIEALAKNPNPFIIITQKELGGKATVPKLRNFIETNNIEILGIDQYSLMDDARAGMRDPTRIQMAHVSEDLFLLSTEYSIPILGLAQANRSGIKDDQDQAPALENIKECDDIAANSSKVLSMRQSSYGLILDIIKNREGKVGDKLLYSWDIDTGHFSYIPSNNDAARPEIRQQVQQQTKQQFAQNTSVNPF